MNLGKRFLVDLVKRLIIRGGKVLCFNNLCPSFISDLLETYKPNRSLQSPSRNLLVIPRSKLKSYGDRPFSVSTLA